MKNVVIFLWGLIIASGWWGFGIMSYTGYLGTTEGGGMFIPFLLLFFGSLLTIVYIGAKIVLCIVRCWDD